MTPAKRQILLFAIKMRQIAAGLLVGAMFVLFQPPAVEGQALRLEGAPIQEIQFEGLVSLAPESLEFYLDVSVGDAYDPAALNRKVHELWATQLIDDIQIEAVPWEQGAKLVITVQERPTLRSVEYVGLKRVERSDIIDRIARDRLRVREGDPVNLGDLQRLQEVIEELYQEKGFRLARAKYALETVSSTDRRVTFTIDEGDKVRIEDIDFEGNTVFGDRRLRFAMKKTKESSLVTKLTRKDVYNPAKMEEDLDTIRELYHKTGYKNVVLGVPRTDVQATRETAEDVADQRRRLFVTLPIEEGGRWKLGEISVEGNETFPDDILLRQFEKPKGGWLRSNVVDEALETIGELYQNTGHLFSQVTSEIKEREDQVGDVVVHVDEGDQFSIGRIDFIGNRTTRDKVLRRELGIQEGMVLNSGALRNSLLRLQQLDFFKVDETDPVAFEFDNEDKKVDLTIKGDEGDRTEMQFGAGFSEIDGFFGQFQFRSRNFLGRGETLSLNLQSGRRQDIYDISYSIPWFLDRPQNIGLQVFKQKLDFSSLVGQSFSQDRLGATLTYGRRLSLFRNASVAYSAFDSEDSLPIVDADGNPEQRIIDRSVSQLRFSQVYDRRNSRINPSRGMQYTVNLDYSGGPLGGNTNFLRPQGSFSYFKPLTRGSNLSTVAAVNVEAGHIEPIGSGGLFPLDRFFLGGENSMRGFRFRSITVRDKDGNPVFDQFNTVLGGNSFAQLNFEYHFLFGGGPFRLLAFTDIGNVFAENQTVDLESFRQSYGVEMRVLVPLFGAPLRFIYSFNADELPGDRFEKFQFSIGTTF